MVEDKEEKEEVKEKVGSGKPTCFGDYDGGSAFCTIKCKNGELCVNKTVNRN